MLKLSSLLLDVYISIVFPVHINCNALRQNVNGMKIHISTYFRAIDIFFTVTFFFNNRIKYSPTRSNISIMLDSSIKIRCCGKEGRRCVLLLLCAIYFDKRHVVEGELRTTPAVSFNDGESGHTFPNALVS